ncbi:MAG: DEAD/DEAH box helicase [Sulfurimonas sp.]|nr:DEAD/DEAH box helicase [Sulfurimonas sp.]
MPEEEKEVTKPKEKKYYDFISIAKRTAQSVYFVAQHDKNRMLELLIKNSDEKQTVVLCKSKKNADSLAEYLKAKEIKATAIHGNHRAEQINDARLSFNVGETKVLITTDMILKSMELPNIERVISYDLPLISQDYFSRLRLVDEIGESICFVSADEEIIFESMEFLMRTEVKELELEDFSPTPAPRKEKKNKKPRHVKRKVKKEIV